MAILTGDWVSVCKWEDGNEYKGNMTLLQNGNQVEGEDIYEGEFYELKGEIKEDAFTGEWKNKKGGTSDSFSFLIKDEGRKLEGHYEDRGRRIPYRAYKR